MVRADRVSIVSDSTMVVSTNCSATWPPNLVGPGH